MFGQQSTIGGNKQVCSFYLKGTCKYGTQCWNLHPQNHVTGVGTLTSPFGVSGNVFGSKTTVQPDSKEFNEFVKQLSGEMTQWERSGQWLFSSFTPLKSHPMLAGFSDVSPEELRMQAYDALKANTSSSYQDHWRKLQEQYKQLRDALRGPTSDAYQAMSDVFHAKGTTPDQQNQSSSSQALKPTSMFGKPSSLFGASSTQSQSGAGLLGAKPQSSIFGGSTLFGGNQPSATPSLFGDASKSTLFGGSTSQGIQNSFGTQQPNVSPFGNTNSNVFKSTATNSGSVFGGPPKIQGGTLFGGSTATNTQAQVSRNIFGATSVTSTTGGSIFGGGSVTITTTSGTGGIFGGGTSTNTTTPSTGGIFGGVTTTTTSTPNTGAGIFGSVPNQTSNLFGNTNQNQPPTFGTNSAFSGSPAPTLFGGSSTGGASSGLFGNKSSFLGGQQGQPQQQPSLFSNPPATAPGIFGAVPCTQQSTAPSVFGGNMFGTDNTVASQAGGGSGLFGSSSNTGQTHSTLFGNTVPSTSSMGLFGKAPAQQQTMPASIGSQPGSLLFGGGATNAATVPASNTRSENYTPLDQLNAADREQFEREDFLYIPWCPPPTELC